MSDLYYKELYNIQDAVLALLASVSSPFYLTGGTALSRFILKHRFSDDLDFFLNHSTDFHKEVDRLVAKFNTSFDRVEINNRQDSYVRVYITHGTSITLKVEFVNDVGYRIGQPDKHPKGFLIDTWLNILSNKITALQRLAGKDYVDTLFISLHFSFNWEDVVNHAKQKDAWINEIYVSEFLFKFDFEKLNEVKFPSSFNPSNIKQEYFEILARESLHGFDNSLFGKKL